ncbi:MAG: exodeoxyribonuclease III [Phycisphaerales bacterium]
MRITTWNINGFRSAVRKGLLAQIECVNPDVLLLQEIRTRPDQLAPHLAAPSGWCVHWHPAERPGYSGVAVWSRRGLRVEGVGLHDDGTDHEGRLLVARIGPIRVASVYLPSGSSGEHRQAEKDRWLEAFLPWSRRLARSNVPTILGGDFNIAHTERDIFHWKSNRNTSGFLPHERAWMSELLDQGWCDFVREQAGDVDGPYSWWSNRGRARELDRGWRIDYVLGNRAAARIAGRAWIDRQAGLAISDHAPVSVDLDVGPTR